MIIITYQYLKEDTFVTFFGSLVVEQKPPDPNSSFDIIVFINDTEDEDESMWISPNDIIVINGFSSRLCF
jgi:hypothetical protein